MKRLFEEAAYSELYRESQPSLSPRQLGQPCSEIHAVPQHGLKRVA